MTINIIYDCNFDIDSKTYRPDVSISQLPANCHILSQGRVVFPEGEKGGKHIPYDFQSS